MLYFSRFSLSSSTWGVNYRDVSSLDTVDPGDIEWMPSLGLKEFELSILFGDTQCFEGEILEI